jgi:tRNA modification GTPase
MTRQNHKTVTSLSNDTIVALSSASGAGAIGLIRLSGTNVFAIADQFGKLASGQKISAQATHSIAYGWVVDKNQEQIDQVLFLIMHGPKTFTGQDVLEITCHNNPFLIEQIIDRAIACGARMASKGEFTRRAIELGKMDLIQAEAINDLIHAQTSQSLKYSLAQMQGSLSHWIAEIQNSVLEILAFCEASFEFLDEEMEFAGEINVKIQALIKKIESLLITFPKQQYIKEGIKIALIGSVNAGKSSLFNALLEKNRAIVTPIPGTTRDSIEAGVVRDGEFFTFIDTAGIRNTNDAIEQEGIDRSFAQAHSADIILLVMDNSKPWSDQETAAYQNILKNYDEKIIVVHNKSDLKPVQDQNTKLNAISVCSTQPETIAKLYQAIKTKTTILKDTDQITCLLNKRQHDLLVNFLQQLKTILPMVDTRKVDYELVVCQLHQALQALSEMTGRSISQAAFDKVFDTFCVGK